MSLSISISMSMSISSMCFNEYEDDKVFEKEKKSEIFFL